MLHYLLFNVFTQEPLFKNCIKRNHRISIVLRKFEFYFSLILIWRIPQHFKFRVELHVAILEDTRFAADCATPDTRYWFSSRTRPTLTDSLRFFPSYDTRYRIGWIELVERERIEERNQFPRDLRDDDDGDSQTNFCLHGKRMDSEERNIFRDDPLLSLYPAERKRGEKGRWIHRERKRERERTAFSMM